MARTSHLPAPQRGNRAGRRGGEAWAHATWGAGKGSDRLGYARPMVPFAAGAGEAERDARCRRGAMEEREGVEEIEGRDRGRRGGEERRREGSGGEKMGEEGLWRKSRFEEAQG
jgi:hypothetical protein